MHMVDEKKVGFGLPSECESAILKYLLTPDLLSLSLVSKHFRDISAAEVYRSFHIVFPDDDDPANNDLDSLAVGLNTFVTSDYNYCQYVKEIILEALSGGIKSEQAYRSYTFDTPCGKFMNTMIALTLRRAKALETFKWDIRVELSREVLKELHCIDALQHFHVRMQKGSSICDPLKDIDSDPTLSFYNPPTFNPPPVIDGVSRTISGFKNLKSLAVLDMDDLNYLSEIRRCIKNSSATLSSLKLSFSKDLAAKSGKLAEIVAPVTDDDTESDDEYLQSLQVPSGVQLPSVPPFFDLFQTPNPVPTVTDIESTTKAMQMKMEKKAQEAALGKIFGIKPSNSKAGASSTHLKEGELEKEADAEKMVSTVQRIFLDWKDEIDRYVAEHGSEMVEELEKKGLTLITNTIDILRAISSEDQKGIHTQTSNAMTGINGNKFASSSVVIPADEGTTTALYKSHDQSSPIVKGTGKLSTKGYKSKDIMNPDAIDVEEPEAEERIEGLKIGKVDATEPETTDGIMPTEDIEDLPASETFEKTITSKLIQNSQFGSAKKVRQTAEPVNNPGKLKETETSIIGAKEGMREYIQRTRGLALKNLSLYLIPLRPSVLFKAIEIRALQTRENRLSPLPLHKIYTDKVTLPFLRCVGELAKVEELLLLERAPIMSKVEPALLAKIVTMKQIRTLVLKKHVSTLRVLSLYQESDRYGAFLVHWDLTPKTAVLLCRKAKKLEELAVAMGTPVMHIINQNLSGLKSLRALHVTQFRSDDTCIWAQKEFKKFIVDSISHNPDCKLEYIAVKGRIVRAYRRVKRCPLPKFGMPSIFKGEDKSDIQIAYHAVATNGGSGNGSVSIAQAKGLGGTTTSMDELAETGSPLQGQELNAVKGARSDSEDEDEYEGGLGEKVIKSLGLKIESVDGYLFHEVKGVRIFEKDVVWKRL